MSERRGPQLPSQRLATLTFTPGAYDAGLHLTSTTDLLGGIGLCGAETAQRPPTLTATQPCPSCLEVAIELGWTAARNSEKSWVNLARLLRRSRT